MKKKETKYKPPIAFTTRFLFFSAIFVLLGISIFFGIYLYNLNTDNKEEISNLHNMLTQIEKYAKTSEFDPDGKPYVNIQIDKPADATTTDLSEILSIVQNQYEQTSNGISTQMTVFSILITIITILIPIFSYNFIQKDQVDRLNKQYDDFSKEFNNKIKEINIAFNKEIERLNKAIEQSTKVSEAVINPESEKLEITPISDSNEDRARANYIQSMIGKDNNRSLEYINHALELDPKNANYYYRKGKILHNLKHYEEAIENKTKAIELEPKNALYYNSRCVTLCEIKHFDDALIDVTKAIALDPNNSSFYRNKGAIMQNIKLYEEAFKNKTKAIELDPKNKEYKASLAITLNRLKKHREALSLIEEAAVSIQEDYIYRHRAYINLRLAMSEKLPIPDIVWQDFNKAIEMGKENSLNYLAIAEAYLFIHQYEQAKQFLDDAYKLDSEAPEIYHSYALYYEGVGDKENAKKYHKLADKYGYIKGPDEE